MNGEQSTMEMNQEDNPTEKPWLMKRLLKKMESIQFLPCKSHETLRERVECFFEQSGAESLKIELSGPFRMTRVVVEWKKR